jgi:hypothetical protein
MAAAAPESGKMTLERITAVIASARTIWLTQLAFLAFIGITLLGVTGLLIWLATPILIAAFWWHSMPAHDARLTLAIGAALLLSLYAALRGWRRARHCLKRAGLDHAAPEPAAPSAG